MSFLKKHWRFTVPAVVVLCVLLLGVVALYSTSEPPEPKRVYVMPESNVSQPRPPLGSTKMASIVKPVPDVSAPARVLDKGTSIDKEEPVINYLTGEIVPRDKGPLLAYLEQLKTRKQEIQKELRQQAARESLNEWVTEVFAPELEEMKPDLFYLRDLHYAMGAKTAYQTVITGPDERAYYKAQVVRFRTLVDEFVERFATVPLESQERILDSIATKWSQEDADIIKARIAQHLWSN